MSVIRLKTLFIHILMWSALLFTQYSYAEKKDVHIGVLAVWGEKVSKRMWQPTMDYLNVTIPDYHFVLTPLMLKQTNEAVKSKKIDFIITNPGNYTVLAAKFGISRLATLKTKNQNKDSNQFGAVIFTRYDREDIQTLKDLKNKSFMGVSKKAFGGFQIAWLEFKKIDIDPFEDFSELKFSGLPQDNIVYSVLNAEVDAGTVRTSTLERMAAEGAIELSQVKVLNLKTSDTFPYLNSTRLYPEWPIAKLKHTQTKLAKDISIALLKLPAYSTAAKQARSSGWTVPLDYFPVQNLFKELNLAPYKVEPENFFKLYWGQIVLFLIFVLQPAILYIIKLKNNLRIDEEIIAKSEMEWSNALDFLDEPMYMVDLNDKIIRANKAFYKKIKSNPESAVGKVVTDFTHPEGEEASCKDCLARKKLIDTVLVLEADDPSNKSGVPTEISVKVIRDESGQAVAIIQRMRDLTESRKAEKALRRSETLFKELLNATPEPLIVSNPDGTIVLINSEFEKQLGYSRDEIIGNKVDILIPAETRKQNLNFLKQFISNNNLKSINRISNLKVVHRNTGLLPVEISINPFSVENDKLIITSIHNISNRITKENELKRLASFPEYSPNPILEFKKNEKVTYANPATTELFPTIIEQDIKHELFSGLEDEYDSLEESYELIRNLKIEDSTYEQKIIYNPETNLFRMYVWDITKLRNLTQKMSYQATHDALTNLVNRREFERRLAQAIDEANHNNIIHTLCYMDLDQFKAVNDSCGHAAGDELLKQLSVSISKKTRGGDTFARLGGDEFGLLLIGCPIDKAAEIAEDIRKTVEDYRFYWDEKTFKVGISIGAVIINKTSGTIKDIQSAADTACYIAKEQGRNRIHIYKTDSSLITKHTNETNWLNHINHALDNNNFILYFQKILAVNDSAHEHYEVLVRMLDLNGMTIPPNSFIPAAERFDIMSSVDSWVIKNTIILMEEKEYKNIIFSINLSGQSLGDLKFMRDCISQVENSRINPNQLCFEITETAMIANLTNAVRSVSALRDLGCKIALDDFGSGLSSFSYLKNLPVDYLKIDGSLIKDMENDPVNITMVKSIIHIGHSMGLETVAEYVENDEVLKILSEMKIDFVQGYGIAKPVPIEEIKTSKIKQENIIN